MGPSLITLVLCACIIPSQVFSFHGDMSEHVRRISRHLRAMPNRDLIKVGTSLGLSTSRLRRMAPFPPDVVVSAWLNQEDDTVETSGLPTLQSLVTALRQYGQEDIANKIVEEFQNDASLPLAVEETVVVPPNFSQIIGTPVYGYNYMRSLLARHKPKQPSELGMSAAAVRKFIRDIKLIIHVINPREIIAATTYITAPNSDKGNTVRVGKFLIGTFAGQKVAVVQTRMGGYAGIDMEMALKTFINARYIFGVGICYAFKRRKYKYADVLVSDKIADFRNYKFDGDTIINRGEVVAISPKLNNIFCKQTDYWNNFHVATNPTRFARATSGLMASMAILVSSEVEKKKIQDAVPEAKGGEMEGFELLRVKNKSDNKVQGVIIIKGVVDYGDELKGDDWQLTAALAAFDFTKTMLTDKADLFESMLKAPNPKVMISGKATEYNYIEDLKEGME